MKRTGTAKRPLAENELLQERIEADLINIQNNRTLVRSFNAPDVAYIADDIICTAAGRPSGQHVGQTISLQRPAARS